MKLYDIYKSKKDNTFIRIGGFLCWYNTDKRDNDDTVYIQVEYLTLADEELTSLSQFNKIATQEEIEEDFELYITADKISTLYGKKLDEVFDNIKDRIKIQEMEDEKFFKKLTAGKEQEIRNIINQIFDEEKEELLEDKK